MKSDPQPDRTLKEPPKNLYFMPLPIAPSLRTAYLQNRRTIEPQNRETAQLLIYGIL